MSILDSNSGITHEWLERNDFIKTEWWWNPQSYSRILENPQPVNRPVTFEQKQKPDKVFHCSRRKIIVDPYRYYEIQIVYFPKHFGGGVEPFLSSNIDLSGHVLIYGSFAFDPVLPLCKVDDVTDVITFVTDVINHADVDDEKRKTILNMVKWS